MNGLRFVGASAVLLAGLAGWAWAAGIEGSKHDFSERPWAEDNTCGACHAPHNSEDPKAAPLWDQNVDLGRRFSVELGKEAESKREKQRTESQPGPGTTSCLRCHDGTVAVSAISGVKGDRFVNLRNPGVYSSAHEVTDHPVGVPYPELKEDFRPVTSVLAKGTVRLPAGQVECVSCHDPHNTAGIDKMLITSNARSALCLTCHDK